MGVRQGPLRFRLRDRIRHLALAEGRAETLIRSLAGRVVLWGLVGSAAVPIIFSMLGVLGVAGASLVEIIEAIMVTGFLGGTFASGSVAIARSAQLKPGEEMGLLLDDPAGF